MNSMEIEKVINKQRRFFETGRTKQYDFRMAALSRLELALGAFEEELIKALYTDLHKSAPESYMAEIGMTRSEIRYLKRHLRKWMQPVRVKTPLSQFPARSYTLAEPHGVTLVMAPWNYPVLLCLEPLADAIAAGNCVVLKPSAYAPAVSAVLKELLSTIYPEKYVAVVEGGRRENARLLEQRFDHIFFTGGVTVGKMVLEKAAGYVTPVTLELGGKSPCIVDKTANLDIAARRIAFGKLLNAGQTCVAPDYILVQEEIQEAFLERLKQQLAHMTRGDALENPDYPRIVNEKHFHRLAGLTEGEQIVYGGRKKAETLQIEPTVLTGVTLASPVMQEEIFGPIFPILTFRTREDIRKVIGSFEKPLAFYLFTRNKDMKHWVLDTFSFGGGCVNDTIVHLASSHMPFGGVGCSGMGAYHGKTGFDTFSHIRGIVESLNYPDIPLRYQPYCDWKDELVRRFL